MLCKTAWKMFLLMPFALVLSNPLVASAIKNDTRIKLGEFLFKDYSQQFLPLKSGNLMTILLSSNLYQLLEVNAKDQCLLISIWMKESWTDDYLFWDPGDFAGRDQLHVPAEHIWRPDTYLQNNIEMDPANTERPMTVTLHPKLAVGPNDINTTQVTMAFPAIYKVTCVMNIKFFPWDQHQCSMEFTSWSFDQSLLNYSIPHNGAGSSNYIHNQEYDLLDFTANTEVRCFPQEDRNTKAVSNRCWSYVSFTLHIKRKPLFYIFNLVVPSFVLTIICFMGLFSLSSSSGERTEKVSLGMTTMLALNIILLVIGDQMPKTSLLVPIIGWYFLTLMLLIACALVATVFVVHLHKTGQLANSKPPSWLVRISCRGTRMTSLKKSVSPASPDKIANHHAHQGQEKVAKQHDDGFPKENEENLRKIYKQLISVSHVLQNVAQKIEERDAKECKLEEWEKAILTLEKILFIVFSMVTCIATVIFLVIGYNQ